MKTLIRMKFFHPTYYCPEAESMKWQHTILGENLGDNLIAIIDYYTVNLHIFTTNSKVYIQC